MDVNYYRYLNNRKITIVWGTRDTTCATICVTTWISHVVKNGINVPSIKLQIIPFFRWWLLQSRGGHNRILHYSVLRHERPVKIATRWWSCSNYTLMTLTTYVKLVNIIIYDIYITHTHTHTHIYIYIYNTYINQIIICHHRRAWSSLVKIMACCLLGIKLLSKQMLIYHNKVSDEVVINRNPPNQMY